MSRNGHFRSLFQRNGANRLAPSGLDSRYADSPSAPRSYRETDPAQIVQKADRFRDAGRYAEAAEAYSAAIELAPFRTDVRVQHGNMLKEIGRLADAEAAYCEALKQAPDDADIHLQLGHALKLQGRRAEAVEAYLRAAAPLPAAIAAKQELFHLGHQPTQEQAFEAQWPVGGVEALMTLTQRVADLYDTVERISASLPDVTAQAAIPVGCYDAFRAIYDVPAPPEPVADCTFAIVLLADSETLESLRGQITAIKAQVHRDWTLQILGSEAKRRQVVQEALAGEPRIAWVELRGDEDPAAAEWRAAVSAEAEWLLLLAPGAVLHPRAIEWFAAAAGRVRADGFVCDEEADTGSVVVSGRLSPELRQVVDYDTLLEANVFGETIVVKRGAYSELFGLEQADSVTMARSLTLLGLAGNGLVGHVPCTLVRRYGSPERDPAARRAAHYNAVRTHLAISKLRNIEVDPGNIPSGPFRVRWRAGDPGAPIAVIIPTRNNSEDLARAVGSLKARAAAPHSLQIVVVDNGSSDAATRTAFDRSTDRSVRVLEIDEPFNWARLNNQAMSQVDAPLVVFANDDVTMLTDGWDQILRGLLDRSEVGAVGARLLYPDDTLQHGGILFGWPGSMVIHDGLYESKSEPGPACRWHVTRAVSAVTGAFLATRREMFLAHGGFDEINLPVAYSDIDYALKLRRAGLKILWTPQITLNHFESKTRGFDHIDPAKRARNSVERAVMERRWGAALDTEPGLNPLWHMATLPFRLLAPPSQARLWAHIERCAARNPWAVAP